MVASEPPPSPTFYFSLCPAWPRRQRGNRKPPTVGRPTPGPGWWPTARKRRIDRDPPRPRPSGSRSSSRAASVLSGAAHPSYGRPSTLEEGDHEVPNLRRASRAHEGVASSPGGCAVAWPGQAAEGHDHDQWAFLEEQGRDH